MTDQHAFQSHILGELRWDAESEAWLAHVRDGARQVRVVVDGIGQPDAMAVSRAEDMFSNWPKHRTQIAEVLKGQAESYRDAGFYEEVMALQVGEVVFPAQGQADPYVAIWFEGPTDERQWHMEFDDRRLRHFGFQW